MIRYKQRVKKDNSERWLLTYCDLITLLLATFIVMYSISTADAQKFQALAESVQKAFNVKVLEGQANNLVDQNEPSVAPEARALMQDDFDFINREMSSFAQEEGLTSGVEVEMRDDGIAIILSDRSLFASGRAELGVQAQKTLDKVAELLRRNDNVVRVEGHTDDVATNNPAYPTNWELSTARALTVVKYLVDEGDIAPDRLSAIGFSQYQPRLPNDSPENRATNRRCEIILVYAREGDSR